MIGKAIVTWIATALALLLSSWLFKTVNVTTFGVALVAGLAIGVLNALLWPTLIRLTLPLTVLTLGLSALALNAAMILLVAAISPGLEVTDFWGGVGCTLVITGVTSFVSSLLFIDDDNRLGQHLVRRSAKRAAGGEIKTDVPGILFLEIDGLAYDVLNRAMRDGNAPEIDGWVRDGSHTLLRWETDWSSQTGACQAGLLHGNNHDMPAFRWWEKDRDKPIVTNHPRDAAELERRVSNGKGLLYADGASRANILSGDATHSLLTMSTVLQRRGNLGRDYFTYFASPYNTARTLLHTIGEVFVEMRAASIQRHRDIQPRGHRDWKYALVRAWGTIIQRDLQVEAVLGDAYAGRPVVYTTFLAYDEVAHHSGIERADTLAVLRHVSHEVGRIARATRNTPRPYKIVVLSDHGQTQGATFLQRYGETLEDVVKRACTGREVVADQSEEAEALGRLSAALTEASDQPTASGRMVAAMTKRKRVDGTVQLEQETGSGDAIPEISVMASGCLGLISFPRIKHRLTRAEVEEHFPALLEALVEHPGVGFVMVDGIVLGKHGWRSVRDASGEGEDPMEPFGPRTAQHVARTDGFPHCPDIMVNSTYWPDREEVAAFEELVGSHGGMGGPQSYPFVLAPSDLPQPDGELVGAEAVHRLFRTWLAHLGQEAYADDQ